MNSFQKQLLLWLKRAIKAAAFLLVFIFLLNTASVILTPKVNKREDGSSEAIHFGYRGEPKDSLDIVMVGNSDLYNSVIPIDLYQNFGIAGYAGGVLMNPRWVHGGKAVIFCVINETRRF